MSTSYEAPPHHEGSPSELPPALQQDLSGLLVPVQDHRELSEEQVGGETSSHPGEAAQQGERGERGERASSRGANEEEEEEEEGCTNEEEEDERGGEEGGERGEETRGHGEEVRRERERTLIYTLSKREDSFMSDFEDACSMWVDSVGSSPNRDSEGGSPICQVFSPRTDASDSDFFSDFSDCSSDSLSPSLGYSSSFFPDPEAQSPGLSSTADAILNMITEIVGICTEMEQDSSPDLAAPSPAAASPSSPLFAPSPSSSSAPPAVKRPPLSLPWFPTQLW
ncbi:hypothetical protein F7725_005040 [Dissostichus mawsoni]|uniref:Uncharacterized protein n=1 Tax=Dissostichus mawsoni TaxID=36200 RepID=A0A7J5XKG1_DISMA|nr:hypothetical protein F7725_005040 [Dissostichus mawsoni]